jgi:hypothetical protein
VIDSEKPDRIVAKLSSNPPQRDNPNSDRYGVFLLIDSEGKELCGVTNNQLQVSRIACNAVTIIDPQNANQALALLTSATGTKPDGASRRLGSLILTDSDGNEQFGLADDQLSMRQIVCEGVAVVNPENRGQVLAALGSVSAKPEGENAKPERFGVLALNNQQFGSLHGNPPRSPLENRPQQQEPDADAQQPAPAEEDASEAAPGESTEKSDAPPKPSETPSADAEDPGDKAESTTAR